MHKPNLIINCNPDQNNGFDFLETIPALIAVLDTRGHIIRINQALSEFIGQPQDRLIGKPFLGILLSGEEVQRAEEDFRQVLQSRGKVRTVMIPPPSMACCAFWKIL